MTWFCCNPSKTYAYLRTDSFLVSSIQVYEIDQIRYLFKYINQGYSKISTDIEPIQSLVMKSSYKDENSFLAPT